jgi:hypothetical protein
MDQCLTIAENLLATRILHADPERMMRWTVDLALAMYAEQDFELTPNSQTGVQTGPSPQAAPTADSGGFEQIGDDDIPF